MRRKNIRLPPAVYRQPGRAYSVTIGTAPRSAVFDNRAFGRACVEELGLIRTRTSARIYAYCLMPDHVHLLIGVPEGFSLSELVRHWKSRCYLVRRRSGRREAFWQRGYYDHAVRADEDLRRAAEYILENPVRAGMVGRPEDYELGGSFEFEL